MGRSILAETLALRIATIVSAPFGENTYVAHLPGAREAIVVDPGMEPGQIIAYLERERLTPAALLITHGHSDHIAGNASVKRRWPDCLLVIGRGDAPKLTDPWSNLSAPFGVNLTSPPADVLLDHGDLYEIAGLKFEVREIPGHSSGHIIFLCRQVSPWVVFGGDVLFAGSIGRTDFPDGDFEQLASGIWRQLFTLPDDTRVLPGHGPATTIGEEKRHNPFVGRNSEYGRSARS
jgi:glyoxylase-like metal-dependent hydrolase (beta-lactamase superfamily II)